MDRKIRVAAIGDNCIDYYDSLNDYIEEVKQMNALANDDITYGQCLIVPYYSNEFIG